MAEETLVDIEEQKEENKVDIMSMTSNELIGQLMDINDKPSLSEQESEYKKLVVAELKTRKANKTLGIIATVDSCPTKIE